MKTQFFRAPFVGVMAALALSTVVSPLRPAIAQAQNVQIGVVDEVKLGDGFKKFADAMGALMKLKDGLDTKLQAREYLTPDEAKTFDPAIVKGAKPGAPANTALDALVKTGQDRRTEYNGLIGKAVRSPEENTRMTLLASYASTNRVPLGALADQLTQQLRDEDSDTSKQYTDQASTVISQVANDRKLLIVVSKSATLYTLPSVDITDEVLRRLNK